jgi:broad specificity phosphatase PhoE
VSYTIEKIRNFLSRLVGTGRSWLFVFWIYLSAGWHFLPWRLRLWLRPSSIAESTHTGMKQTLLFIRHGQTTWNVEHRLPGQLPGVTLNDTGRKQAARLADALHILPISAIISSPLERARDTAEIIAQSRGLSIQLEPDLMDVNVGHWAGKIFDELAKNDPDWKAFVRDPSVAPEGVETFPQVQERVLAAVERWRTRENTGTYIAFVAHADIIKLLIAHYTGLEAGRAGTLFIDNASVSLVELDGDQRPRVVGIGWSPHPGWLKPPEPEPAKSEPAPSEEQKT